MERFIYALPHPAHPISSIVLQQFLQPPTHTQTHTSGPMIAAARSLLEFILALTDYEMEKNQREKKKRRKFSKTIK